MIRPIVVGAWLTAVWAALWGEFSPANLLSGAVIATVLLLLFPSPRDPRHGTFRPVAAARFTGYFLGQLLVSNLRVAWEVLTPRNDEREAILAIPVVPSCSPTLLSMLVNSIGLTPGTMVVDLTERPRVIYVHLLQVGDVEEARAGVMTVQRLVIEAFGSDAAVAELDQLPAPGREGER
jgi:multicomponent Na+:H+ antiporter subunit E